MSSALMATLILPFNQELPEGLTACKIISMNDDKSVNEDEPTTNMIANTPYVIHGTEQSVGSYTFEGIPVNTKDKYSEGLLVGSYKALYTANGDFRCDGTEYFLQNQDGKVGWYVVMGGDLTLGAYKCYLDLTLG